MTRRALVLLLFVIAAMSAGFFFGYRLRISQEEVFVHPPEWQHPHPPADLSSEYDGEAWAYLYPVQP